MDSAEQRDRPREMDAVWHGGQLRLVLSGDWLLGGGFAEAETVLNLVAERRPTAIVVDGSKVGRWDSALPIFLQDVFDAGRSAGVDPELVSLPGGSLGLIGLAEAVPEKKDASHGSPPDGLLVWVGKTAIDWHRQFVDLLAFIGEGVIAGVHMVRGRARFRSSDFWLIVQHVGADAVPIVGLLSFLVGLIFAFVGAIQLELFGAQLLVANLVGISMTREMGAIITGVIMSGRTGAAFAAALGSMKVNQEIDALKTLGISPIEFLVLPRALAMLMMLPLLVLYSNMLGILGGMVVCALLFDITPMQFLQQTMLAVDMNQFFCGVSKSFVFAILIAASGCLRGLQCGSGSAAVGQAATSAVVTGITSIIIADAVFAFAFEVIGI